MKKLISLISILAVAFVLFIAVRNNVNKDVPEKIKAAFAKLYPDVKDVAWHTEKGNYEGKFNYNYKDMSVQFNDNGELLQTEIYLKASELPQPVQDYLTQNYSGVSFNQYSVVTDASNVKHYQAETKDKVLYFDANGNFTKAVDNDENNDKDDDDY